MIWGESQAFLLGFLFCLKIKRGAEQDTLPFSYKLKQSIVARCVSCLIASCLAFFFAPKSEGVLSETSYHFITNQNKLLSSDAFLV
ncbi:MAG: hypothetical protein ACI828_001664 [Flavobacteriales bacterium]|jgi:hypothetical protein